jgi:ABC-type multidrug transport system fused ATPase/permease subunit
MTLRLELTTSLVLFCVTLLCVLIREMSSAISLGMALSQGLQLTALFQRCIQVSIDMATYFTSTERILGLSREISIEINTHSPPSQEVSKVTSVVLGDYQPVPVAAVAAVAVAKTLEEGVEPEEAIGEWSPSAGKVEFLGVSMRYRPNTPLVLRNVSFTVNGGEMVGICGRTGCGKSSLIQALFRIVECDAGKILIDNREIKSIPLRMLREGLAIIPQDPTIFQGTLRFQLDPFIRHTDAELFSVLQMVSLEGYVSQLTSGLNHLIVEGGENPEELLSRLSDSHLI